MNERALRGASRRLRHRSRSVAVTVALIPVIAASIWLGTESVLAASGQPALLQTPAQILDRAGDGDPRVIAIGAGLALLGLIAVVLAIAPGRLARRELVDARAVVLIDDIVLASGISRAAAGAAGVSPDLVRTAVSRRRAVSRIRPLTGYPPDRDATTDAARAVVTALSPSPAPRTRVVIERSGVSA